MKKRRNVFDEDTIIRMGLEIFGNIANERSKD